VDTGGIVGNDSKVGCRASGSYEFPKAINLAASVISNGGYPYQSSFAITRALAAAQGVALTRASQTVVLSNRGDERFDTVTSVDMRISRPFRFNGHKFQPSLDIFNLMNSDVKVNQTTSVGGAYLAPVEILAPRIIRIAFAFDF